MVLWFIGGSIAIVWAVFQDPAIDFRLVVAGALAPDLVDGLWGGPRVLHSLAGCAVWLVVVMLATRNRRAARRRLLWLPTGALIHLVLDGMWTDIQAFWWPFRGLSFVRGGLPSFRHPVWLTVGEEIAGLIAMAWFARRFELLERARLRRFVRTGRVQA